MPRYKYTLATGRDSGILRQSSFNLRWDASGIHECRLDHDHLQAGSHSLRRDSMAMDVEACPRPPWTLDSPSLARPKEQAVAKETGGVGHA